MKRFHVHVMLVAALAIPFSLAVARAQTTFEFYLSAIDSAGEPVTDLRPEEVLVTENGAAASIDRMELIARPVRVQVLVDNGLGTGSQLVQFRSGLKSFFSELPLGLEASLITMAPQPRFLARPTTDRLQLTRAVDRLSPDEGAAKFVDALIEAGGRIAEENRGRDQHFPVIVILSTTGPEGSSARERDLDRMLVRLRENSATVHVIMLGTGPQTVNSVSGARQVGIGKYLADDTGGRYEAIAAATRVMTLLPEYGQMVAKAHTRQHRQYRVTAQRPGGSTGPMGQLAMAVRRPGVTGMASLDGRMPTN